MHRLLLHIFFLSLWVAGCSSKDNDAEKQPLVIVDSFEVWHNLMPGGEPALHFTSLVRVEQKLSYSTDSVRIDKVLLYLNEKETAMFKTTVSDITGEYPDSAKGKWNIYRISSAQGYQGFEADVYDGYTAVITISGAFGEVSVRRTGISVLKVY